MKSKCGLLGLFCVLLTGCGSSGLVAVSPRMEVEIVNQSSRDLENTGARFGSQVCEWGWVVRAATKSYLFYPHPITPQAELQWDEAGKHRVTALDLSKVYVPGKSGRLTFTVRDDGVVVSFRER